MLHKPTKLNLKTPGKDQEKVEDIYMMNANTNNNTQAAAIAAINTIAAEAIAAIKAIMTEATAEEATTTETTATTTEATTEEKSHLDEFLESWSKAPTAGELANMMEDPKAIVVLDDDDSVIASSYATTTEETATAAEATLDDDDNIEFSGSMIENDPCDPMLSAEDAVQEIAADTADEETTEKMLDDIIADISALYDIAEYSLRHEGKNISTDNSPYSPKDNVVGSIDCYNVYISKEVVKGDHVEGSFRMIIKDKVIVNPIMELELRLIDNHYKIFSSENVHRMEKMKEDHNLMRFLEITEEVSALVMSRYIAD